MMRVFRFKNNFLSERTDMVSAEYSAIGYFDGMEMECYFDYNQILKILNDPYYSVFTKKKDFEMCDYFNIIGIREKEDIGFWKKGGKPYLFISCIRLKRWSLMLNDIIHEIENTLNAVCYTTFDSSDIIVCLKTASYREGYSTIERYRKIIIDKDSKNQIQKAFSVFMIWQEVLDGLAGQKVSESAKKEIDIIKKESLSCILKGVIKNWSCFKDFELELRTIFDEKYICTWGVLGSEDIAIELKDVDSKIFLSLYCRDCLLTHSNELYQKALYNIRTELLVEI